MNESNSSLLILMGGALVLALLWYLSYLFVRRDTRRRGLGSVRRKAWLVVTVGLPLFGFALYLFAQILQGYLRQPEEEQAAGEAGHITDSKPARGPAAQGLPATGGRAPGMAAAAPGMAPGMAAVYDAQPGRTPPTVSAFHLPLAGAFELLVTQGPHAGMLLLIARLPLRIGRAPETDLVLGEDLNVSRDHAEIYEWAGALRIRDAGSTYGTQVNGVPVTDQAINPGDRIHVGGTTIILRQKGSFKKP